jgi:hypothetical protein
MRTSTSCGKNASCPAAAAGAALAQAVVAPRRMPRRCAGAWLLRVLVLIENQNEARIYLFLTPRAMDTGRMRRMRVLFVAQKGKVKKRPNFALLPVKVKGGV